MRLVPTSLRSRVALLFLAGSLLLLVVLVGALYAVLDRELVRSVDRGIHNRSDDLTTVVQDGDSLPDRDPFVQLLGLDGSVVEQSPIVTRPEAVLDESELQSITDTRWFQKNVRELGGTGRLMARPVEVSGSPMVLVVGGSLDSYVKARQYLLAAVLVASPLVLLTLAAAGWMLAGAALRPVRRLISTAATLPVDQLDRRLPVPDTRDEIEQLARTINGMLDRVERSVAHERRFIDDASHELRTPISILRGELELALARPDDHDEVVASLRSAFDEAVRLGRLADDLLVLARVRAGQLSLHPIELDLAVTVQAAVGALGDGGPEVEVVGRGRAWADPDRVRQIVLNLMTNARRHADRRIRVEIDEGPSAPGGAARCALVVADDGPGFAASMLPVSFERFARPDAARGRDTGGTGLGLSIAAALVRAQGGSIEAANGGPLGGAVVRVELPAGRTAADVQPETVA